MLVFAAHTAVFWAGEAKPGTPTTGAGAAGVKKGLKIGPGTCIERSNGHFVIHG
ncbi:hypothetical protein SDC9_198864 [bioreactor metagenome]|uniref:Uncharacterized protein n=1 Tax=bioreactor metagenome TaxID=1076179 RepID=A0A645IK30_9ZZZZ